MQKPLMYGILGSLVLLSVYFGILTFANSFGHAVEQFAFMWYWVAALALGFGTQVGLFFHVRESMRAKMAAATAEVAAAGGISTGSMVACCAHHITDVLPIIGLSAAATMLIQYQTPFMVLGVMSNVVGITMMLNVIQKHGLFGKKGWLRGLSKYNMENARDLAFVSSVMLVSAVFMGTAFLGQAGTANTAPPNGLQAVTDSQNGVTITATPAGFGSGAPVKIELKLDTHQGALDFDLTKISVLEDNLGNSYQPTGWEGSPSGGHHGSGTLTFPPLKAGASSVKLIIKGVYGIPERTFSWNL